MEEVDIDFKHPPPDVVTTKSQDIHSNQISNSINGREPRTTSQSSIHSGVGNLTGGGVTKIYTNRPTMKDYKQKLDHRLGPVLLACLTTIATILFIYGLYYEQVQSSMEEYIHTLQDHIAHKSTTTTTTTIVPLPEVLSTTTADVTAVVEASVPPPNSELEDQHEAEDRINKQLENGANMQLDVQSQSHRRRKRQDQEKETNIPPLKTATIAMEDSTPSNSPADSLPTFIEPDNKEEISLNELSEYDDRFHSAHIAVWVLASLNLMAAKTPFKAIYRVFLALALLFICSIQFPRIVDRLFVEGLPRPILLLEPIEQTFGCVFAFHEVLVQYKIQEPLRQARHRVELNKQKRPQSREQILSHTLSNGRTKSSEVH
uniref:Uncharacterized protein n=1 Tax=Ditylenchus dipsaci TaxID=166011 RepID=A0A915EIH6_9BILA